MGPKAVTFISNDDKARVALGLAAAKLQAPVLMHLDYRVRLLDHSFVVGERHISKRCTYLLGGYLYPASKW